MLGGRARRRWLGWGLLVTTAVVAAIHRISTAVLSNGLVTTFGLTASELGFVHAGFFYTYAATQVPAGVVTDRWGARSTAVIGTLVLGVASLAFAASPSYPAVVGARVVMGLGGGVLYVATLRYAANWFRPDEFATVTGLTIGAFGFGGILAATPLALVVGALGWRRAVTVLGVVGMLLAVGVWAFVRDTPREAGFDPVAETADRTVPSFRGAFSGAKAILGCPETWGLGAVMFAVVGTNLTLLGLWGVPYLVQLYGLSVPRASLYTLLGSTGWLIGPILGGRVAAATGRRLELVVGASATYTLSFLVLAAAGTPPLPVVGVVFFAAGFLVGGFSLSFTVIKEQHDDRLSGTATGIVNAFGVCGGAVLPAVMGLVLDSYWTGSTVDGTRVYTPAGYRVAFGLATLMGVVAFLAAVWLYRRGYGVPPHRR